MFDPSTQLTSSTISFITADEISTSGIYIAGDIGATAGINLLHLGLTYFALFGQLNYLTWGKWLPWIKSGCNRHDNLL